MLKKCHNVHKYPFAIKQNVRILLDGIDARCVCERGFSTRTRIACACMMVCDSYVLLNKSLTHAQLRKLTEYHVIPQLRSKCQGQNKVESAVVHIDQSLTIKTSEWGDLKTPHNIMLMLNYRMPWILRVVYGANVTAQRYRQEDKWNSQKNSIICSTLTCGWRIV